MAHRLVPSSSLGGVYSFDYTSRLDSQCGAFLLSVHHDGTLGWLRSLPPPSLLAVSSSNDILYGRSTDLEYMTTKLFLPKAGEQWLGSESSSVDLEAKSTSISNMPYLRPRKVIFSDISTLMRQRAEKGYAFVVSHHPAWGSLISVREKCYVIK